MLRSGQTGKAVHEKKEISEADRLSAQVESVIQRMTTKAERCPQTLFSCCQILCLKVSGNLRGGRAHL